MITFVSGDIFQEDAEALVNTVNCVGIMGRGLALQFKKAYPDNFKAYEKACNANEIEPGKMFVFDRGGMFNPRYVINFPTKRHWRGNSKMEDIEKGLTDLVRVILENDIQSIAIPPLGSGLGGLNWDDVKLQITKALESVDARIIVYEPVGPPAVVAGKEVAPSMTRGRATLVELIDHYTRALLDPDITLLEIHKLMYFMQASGEDLRLRFKKAYYGPYAENLGHVLSRIEGYYTVGYRDGGDLPNKRMELVPGAIDEARVYLNSTIETREHEEIVIKLVQGFESSFGLELLASVHWVVTMEEASNINDVVDKVYEWNPRKQKFTFDQIELAYERLNEQGWFNKRVA